MKSLFRRFFDTNSKNIERYQRLVSKINQLEPPIQKLADSDLAAKTQEFKSRLTKGENLNDLLPEAFAVVREASVRVNKQRHFDVQLIAGIAFHEGKVAEQKTGEGKTLSATTAVYLNALVGRGVHVVTVNDYLAQRDGGWMAQVYHFLGLTTGVLIHDLSYIYDPEYQNEAAQDWRFRHLKQVSRKEAYAADITYGTNNEFGFDYLRDNMATQLERVVQRGHYFAIVDEVDSILIDEARTPLIISAPAAEATDKYYQFAKLVDILAPKLDYIVNEKHKAATLTENGIKKLEKRLGVDNLYEKDFETIHHVENALKAKAIYHREKEYVVRDGEVIIVDEYTGRLMPGRRYSDGLHQAIEAKEGVRIQQESRTLATISIQNYFRMYEKLAGMTGTASTEAEEFEKIYKMEVVVVPTNRAIARLDYPDYIYKNERAKLEAIGREIEKIHATGQPILVGTRDIEHNELLSRLLKHKGIKHEVLNAKNHLREAQIIARAGERGAVTIATNMAGRGVDIALGGAQPQKTEDLTPEQYQEKIAAWEQHSTEIKALGGLYVIGTERHESRRIDNQLRGRSGRQGDPGATRFFVAMSDEIIRVFGGDRIAGLMTLMKMPENVPIEHAMVSKAIENAQSKVEGFYFDMRKGVVEYDDVMNKQRDILYKLRRSILEMQYTADTEHPLKQKLFAKIEDRLRRVINAESGEELHDEQYTNWMRSVAEMLPLDEAAQNHIKEKLVAADTYDGAMEVLSQGIREIYNSREQQFGSESIFSMEKNIYLNVIDELWMNHLDNMQTLREGISLRAYGQRDPLVEYKGESFKLFQKLLQDIDYNLINRIFRSLPSNAYELFMNQMLTQAQEQGPDQNASSSAAITAEAQSENPVTPAPSIQSSIDKFIPQVPKGPGESTVKISRNDPCWCGSGKKWKKCHYPATS